MAASDELSGQRFYHGTKAVLRPGDLIEPGHAAGSGGEEEATEYAYFSTSLDAAAWEGEVAPGGGPGRIYSVEPTGPVADDPDPRDTKHPAGPGKPYRSRAPLRVTGECTDPQGRPPRLYHGTKADLKPGDLLAPGYSPNFGDLERTTTYIYLAGTLDAATWGAELAIGDGPGRIYVVEPTGPMEDDPNLTDQRFHGNPTKSYRSREPLRVTGEVADWQGHPPEALKAMKDGIARSKEQGVEPMD